MMAVIFEVEPAAGAMDQYLDLAASLREELSAIDGFISIERFESLSHKGRILSLSFWRDEESIRRWRTLEAHRTAQVRGRSALFADYRLRVAEVVRDYGRNERAQAPRDSRARHGD
jgi:heme-degrading monooxygenase HmoA